jgi:invasion protein IalB
MMSDRSGRQFFLTAALAAMLLASPAFTVAPGYGQQNTQPATPASPGEMPAMASRGQRDLVRPIKYGDWQKFCFNTPGSKTVCRTTITGTFDTGQVAVRADLIEREGEAKGRMQIFLPVGLYLRTPVKLTVDQGKPYEIPYSWCMTNTCVAGNPADPQLIREMEKGDKLSLEVVDSSVQSIVTELPLQRFAAVRKGVPTKTFVQDIDE